MPENFTLDRLGAAVYLAVESPRTVSCGNGGPVHWSPEPDYSTAGLIHRGESKTFEHSVYVFAPEGGSVTVTP